MPRNDSSLVVMEVRDYESSSPATFEFETLTRTLSRHAQTKIALHFLSRQTCRFLHFAPPTYLPLSTALLRVCRLGASVTNGMTDVPLLVGTEGAVPQ